MIEVYGFNEKFLFEKSLDSPCEHKNIHWKEDCILEQFTGLTDKNGVEIYEGDILKTKFGNKIFFSDLVDYHLWNLKSGDAFSKIQIIGNIHENPELI